MINETDKEIPWAELDVEAYIRNNGSVVARIVDAYECCDPGDWVEFPSLEKWMEHSILGRYSLDDFLSYFYKRQEETDKIPTLPEKPGDWQIEEWATLHDDPEDAERWAKAVIASMGL